MFFAKANRFCRLQRTARLSLFSFFRLVFLRAAFHFATLFFGIHFRPTLQQPLLPPNPQFQSPLSSQVNGPFPFPQRQRAVDREIIDNSLMMFLRTMEMQFQEKHPGETLDGTCEDRFFCEVALIGRNSNADALHRMLYNVAME